MSEEVKKKSLLGGIGGIGNIFGGESSLLFFFLLLVIIFCNCGLFYESGDTLLFFFLLLVLLFGGPYLLGGFGRGRGI